MINNYFMKKKVVRDLKYNQASMEGLGLAWYKFNIYLRMFFGVILLLKDMFDTTTDASAAFAFAFIWDSACIVLMLLSRQWLTDFKYKGIVCYFVVQYGSVIATILILLCGVLFETVDPAYFMGYTVASLVVYGIFFLLERKYWKKRAHLFDRDNQLAQGTQVYIETETDTTGSIIFCRKCGGNLMYGAKFCQKCGTEVIEETNENEML